MGERKVGEVQWEVSGVNEIFSSGGPERIAEIAEAGMINISQGKLPLGCFLHTDSTPTCTHTPSSSSPPSSAPPNSASTAALAPADGSHHAGGGSPAPP